MRILTGLLLILALVLPASAALSAERVAEGEWTTVDYDVEGRWWIEAEGNRLTVHLGDDFRTKNGPDLHLLLTSRPLQAVTDDNAIEGALVVGRLVTRDTSRFFRKMQGAQSFTLPAGTRLDDYRTLLIHCVEFSHLWAGAPLR